MSELSTAVNDKNAKVVKALLAAGADPNEGPLLARAMRLKSKTMVKALLAAGADPCAPDPDGHTPLHLLAKGMRDVKIGALLLDAGAAIDGKDTERYCGFTALHCAVKVRKLEFATFLVERGANLEIKDDANGETPLMMLLRSESGEISNSERTNALWLLDHGADLNATNEIGSTPLHHAAENGSVELVNLLLDRGATLATNHYGATPLRYTMSTNAKDTAMWDRLLALGCDLEQKSHGSTVLSEAQTNWNPTAVKWCLANGADPKAVDSDGMTPLESARDLNQKAIIPLLEAAE